MAGTRRALVTALAVAGAIVAPMTVAPQPAQAATYRYWSYWTGSPTGWSFANVGPAYRIPADGEVEGWRYSVSGVEGQQTPTWALSFDDVCASTAAVPERKRVAVVVDPGTESDAPAGVTVPGGWAMCVVADMSATGYDLLRAAATVRTDGGLICAIGGYPATGCADVTDAAATTPVAARPEPTYSLLTSPLDDPAADDSAGGLLVGGIAVVGVIGLAVAALVRMRRSAP